MAKKVRQSNKVAERVGEGRTCGECSRGTYDDKHINKDVDGRPFLKVCEFSTWHIVNGRRVCLNGTPACQMFREYEVHR